MAKIAKDYKITFFPVGNGDTTLITLKDGTTILIDCNITKDSEDTNIDEKYDVISYLLNVIEKDSSKRPHLSAFILTHPDQDHCRQFSEKFYLGDPSKYPEKETDKIIVDELWFAPRIFNEHKNNLNEDAKELRKEADRRIKLYKEGKKEKNNAGNRIRIIGSTDNEDFDELESVITPAGKSINTINGKVQDEFNFFVLGPIKAETDDSEVERNQCSIVLKAQFNINSSEVNNVVILAGDSRVENWKRIMNINELEDLKFDIFLAPHHCSWYFFTDKSYDSKPTPNAEQEILDFLNNTGEESDDRVIVASCKEIKRNEDNPPHYRAKNLYVKAVGEENFYCLSEYPSTESPKPLEFTFTESGPVLEESVDESTSNFTSSTISRASSPKTYGEINN